MSTDVSLALVCATVTCAPEQVTPSSRTQSTNASPRGPKLVPGTVTSPPVLGTLEADSTVGAP